MIIQQNTYYTQNNYSTNITLDKQSLRETLLEQDKFNEQSKQFTKENNGGEISKSQFKVKDQILKKYLDYELLETLQKYDPNYSKYISNDTKVISLTQTDNQHIPFSTVNLNNTLLKKPDEEVASSKLQQQQQPQQNSNQISARKRFTMDIKPKQYDSDYSAESSDESDSLNDSCNKEDKVQDPKTKSQQDKRAGGSQLPLSKLRIFIEVFQNGQNISDNFGKLLQQMGAKITKRLTKKCKLIVWKDGSIKTYNKAKQYKIVIVNCLWIEACIKSEALVSYDKYIVSNPTEIEKAELLEISSFKKKKRKSAVFYTSYNQGESQQTDQKLQQKKKKLKEPKTEGYALNNFLNASQNQNQVKRNNIDQLLNEDNVPAANSRMASQTSFFEQLYKPMEQMITNIFEINEESDTDIEKLKIQVNNLLNDKPAELCDTLKNNDKQLQLKNQNQLLFPSAKHSAVKLELESNGSLQKSTIQDTLDKFIFKGSTVTKPNCVSKLNFSSTTNNIITSSNNNNNNSNNQKQNAQKQLSMDQFAQKKGTQNLLNQTKKLSTTQIASAIEGKKENDTQFHLNSQINPPINSQNCEGKLQQNIKENSNAQNNNLEDETTKQNKTSNQYIIAYYSLPLSYIQKLEKFTSQNKENFKLVSCDNSSAFNANLLIVEQQIPSILIAVSHLSKGNQVVNMKWIDQTVEKNKFAELTNFLLKPTEIPNSILNELFKGLNFYVYLESVQLKQKKGGQLLTRLQIQQKAELESILRIYGGKAVDKIRACDICLFFKNLTKIPSDVPSHVRCLTVKWVFDSVLQNKKLPFVIYSLN